jgi:polyisoprenoid-binding protein YceI
MMRPTHRETSSASGREPASFLLFHPLLPAFLALAALSLSTPPGAAQERVLRVDPAASEVTFVVDSTLHEVHGRFAVREGEIRFDPAGGPASGQVVVDVASGDTGKEGRDKDMHNKVLESERFPLAVLTIEGVQGAIPASGSGKVKVTGTLELHGGRHRVAIPTEIEVQGDRLQATGTLDIPYVEWGMKDPSKLVLRMEKQVHLTLQVSGRLDG